MLAQGLSLGGLWAALGSLGAPCGTASYSARVTNGGFSGRSGLTLGPAPRLCRLSGWNVTCLPSRLPRIPRMLVTGSRLSREAAPAIAS